MGGLFKKPKAPEPDPKIEEQERVDAGKKLAAKAQSRRRGGRKGLMAEGVTVGTPGREVEQLQSTLGRNPRSG